MSIKIQLIDRDGGAIADTIDIEQAVKDLSGWYKDPAITRESLEAGQTLSTSSYLYKRVE